MTSRTALIAARRSAGRESRYSVTVDALLCMATMMTPPCGAGNPAGASQDSVEATLEAALRSRKAGAPCVETVEAREENGGRDLADGGRGEEAGVRSEEAGVRSIPAAAATPADVVRSVATPGGPPATA